MASGLPTHPGVVAADARVFPMGTRLHLPGSERLTVEDTGTWVHGRHVDVWVPSCSDARRWGAQHLTITVEGARIVHND